MIFMGRRCVGLCGVIVWNIFCLVVFVLFCDVVLGGCVVVVVFGGGWGNDVCWCFGCVVCGFFLFVGFWLNGSEV